MSQLRSSIRKSRDSDLSAIHSWLVDEERRGVHGNFLCNWSRTEEAHAKRQLLVYFSAEEGIPIAYQWGALLSPGILQVKWEHRNKGVGTKLVRHLIRQAKRGNNDILRVECVPSSSVSFWERMGFKVCIDGVNAFQILSRSLDVPEGCVDVPLEIRFFPECRKWEDDAAPLESRQIVGHKAQDGRVFLDERVHFYPYQYSDIHDPVVEILEDGNSVYRDKLKYPQTEAVGAKPCKNGWHFDHFEYERGQP